VKWPKKRSIVRCTGKVVRSGSPSVPKAPLHQAKGLPNFSFHPAMLGQTPAWPHRTHSAISTYTRHIWPFSRAVVQHVSIPLARYSIVYEVVPGSACRRQARVVTTPTTAGSGPAGESPNWETRGPSTHGPEANYVLRIVHTVYGVV
jgi:hypothetical protein